MYTSVFTPVSRTIVHSAEHVVVRQAAAIPKFTQLAGYCNLSSLWPDATTLVTQAKVQGVGTILLTPQYDASEKWDGGMLSSDGFGEDLNGLLGSLGGQRQRCRCRHCASLARARARASASYRRMLPSCADGGIDVFICNELEAQEYTKKAVQIAKTTKFKIDGSVVV